MISYPLLLFLGITLAAPAFGQQPEAGGQTGAEPVQQEQPVKKERQPEPQGTFTPFKPTEKVDADASIPFPADI